MNIVNPTSTAQGQQHNDEKLNDYSWETLLKGADNALRTFQSLSEREYSIAQSLYYAAVNSLEQMKLHCKRDKRRVLDEGWGLDDFARDMTDLCQKEHVIWDRLLADAVVVRERIDRIYGPVITSEEALKESFSNNAVLHTNTNRGMAGDGSHNAPDQIHARSDYNYELRLKFEDAHKKYQQFCAYPDGLLTKITLYHNLFLMLDLKEWSKKNG